MSALSTLRPKLLRQLYNRAAFVELVRSSRIALRYTHGDRVTAFAQLVRIRRRLLSELSEYVQRTLPPETTSYTGKYTRPAVAERETLRREICTYWFEADGTHFFVPADTIMPWTKVQH